MGVRSFLKDMWGNRPGTALGHAFAELRRPHPVPSVFDGVEPSVLSPEAIGQAMPFVTEWSGLRYLACMVTIAKDAEVTDPEGRALEVMRQAHTWTLSAENEARVVAMLTGAQTANPSNN